MQICLKIPGSIFEKKTSSEQKRLYRDFISQLPEKISVRILQYLTPKELGIAGRVSKVWKRISETGVLWESKCRDIVFGSFCASLTVLRTTPNFKSVFSWIQTSPMDTAYTQAAMNGTSYFKKAKCSRRTGAMVNVGSYRFLVTRTGRFCIFTFNIYIEKIIQTKLVISSSAIISLKSNNNK